MEVTKEIIVNQPIQAVWEVLGNQYTDAYKWARGLYHSQGSGSPTIEGATCSNRTCDTSFGRIQEEIKTFDSQNYILAYEVIKGFPGFIKQGINTWRLSKSDVGSTKVSMRFTAETKGFLGLVMGPMMKMQLNKGLGEVLNDFKHYVETGQQSPEKIKDNEKNVKKLKQAA